MKFSDSAQQATAEYMKEAKLPKTFTKENITQFKLLLAYKFHMDLEGIDKKDLDAKDQQRYLNIEVLATHIHDSLYKECLKNARLVKVGKAIKAKKGKKGKKHKDTVVYVRRRSRISAFVDNVKDRVMDTALNASIWVNDVLNGI